ncbi:uncharacterized protein LOC124367946 [Homalodisca vitripennis]|uniref:uncharacterized protein LOC124367946 n=1 Tax=Homalodisca vitripennis TaxID=197043 RepID=UPI001EEB891F|nr:uncharacterized protein LOC124367946 [Homalodisca vitripennis]
MKKMIARFVWVGTHLECSLPPNQHAYTPGRSCNSACINWYAGLRRMTPKGAEEQLDLLGFTRYIVRTYMRTCTSHRSSAGRPSQTVSSRVLPEIRFSGKDHHLETVQKQIRCGTVFQSNKETVQDLSSVPQGSKLGPILFNLFVNDIISHLSSEYLLFADDLKIFKEIYSRDDCLNLQRDLNLIAEWCDDNKMVINSTKCLTITFCRLKNPVAFNYTVSGDIKRVTSINDLGKSRFFGLEIKTIVMYGHLVVSCAPGFAVMIDPDDDSG